MRLPLTSSTSPVTALALLLLQAVVAHPFDRMEDGCFADSVNISMDIICGETNAVLDCVQFYGSESASLQTCLEGAGCTAKEAHIEQTWVVERCRNPNTEAEGALELRHIVARETSSTSTATETTTSSSTATTSDSTATSTTTSATSSSATATTTSSSTSATSSTTASSTSSTASSTSTSSSTSSSSGFTGISYFVAVLMALFASGCIGGICFSCCSERSARKKAAQAKEAKEALLGSH